MSEKDLDLLHYAIRKCGAENYNQRKHIEALEDLIESVILLTDDEELASNISHDLDLITQTHKVSPNVEASPGNS